MIILNNYCTTNQSLEPGESAGSKQQQRRRRQRKPASFIGTNSMAPLFVLLLLALPLAALVGCPIAGCQDSSKAGSEQRIEVRPRRALTRLAAWAKQQQNLSAATSTVKPTQQQPDKLPAQLQSICLLTETKGQQQSSDQFNQAYAEGQSFGYTQALASDYVKPNFYTLRLKLDPMKRKFSGQLMISVDVLAPSGDNATDDNVLRDKNTGELGYRYVSLHAGLNIQIKKAFYVYTTRGSVQIPATKIGKSAGSELLTLDYYPNVITSGQGLLLIVYTGLVNETDSHGLFLHHSTSKKWSRTKLSNSQLANNATAQKPVDMNAGLATQMQPNFARRLLPCWDEPNLKARFNLIIVIPFRNYVALSNMPIKRKSISLSPCSGESLQEIEFQTTPTMSTYLLTLVIGKFDYLEALSENNLKIRAYVYSNSTSSAPATPSNYSSQSNSVNAKKVSSQLALQVAVRTFDLFETILGVKYPLNKFDMVSLKDFDNGGMENWGLSLFRESYFLYDSNSTQSDIQLTGGRSRSRKIEVPLVVAHEIAHQWFGNLVTSKSWTYLWLNEGFAQLLMYDIANVLYPNELYYHLFLEDIRASAMKEDELITSSRSLEFELENSNEHITLFDKITYNKGAMIVKILQTFIGTKDLFNAGLKHYLMKHSYDSVTSNDLWVALEESTGKQEHSIGPLMSNWVRQEGYPMIAVQLIEENSEFFKLKLTQERFTLIRINQTSFEQQQQQQHSVSGHWWSIPIFLSCELNPAPKEEEASIDLNQLKNSLQFNSTRELTLKSSLGFLMTDKSMLVNIPKSRVGSWFKLNFNATGYYRVDYADPELLQRMSPALKSQRMFSIDKYNLIDDLFSMVVSGRKTTKFYLQFLTQNYQEISETELLHLRFIFESLRKIRSLLSNSSDEQFIRLYDRFVLDYIRKLSSSLQSSSMSANDSNIFKLRPPMSQSAGQFHQSRELKEIQDLIGTNRVLFNDGEYLSKALDLFNKRFRLQPMATDQLQAAADESVAFGLMNRELKASIYAGALLASSSVDEDLAPDFVLADELLQPAGKGASVAHMTASNESSAGLSSVAPFPSILTHPPKPAAGSVSRLPKRSLVEPDDVYLRLLKAYESSELGNSDRFAIVQALGFTNKPNKLQKLLNLTLQNEWNYFKPLDLVTLYDQIGRHKLGRQLIWQLLTRETKLIERKSLFIVFIKSLINNCLLDDDEGTVERQLRSLYQLYGQEYGKPIGQLIELVRIQTQWFKRDFQLPSARQQPPQEEEDSLLKFLQESSSANAHGHE